MFQDKISAFRTIFFLSHHTPSVKNVWDSSTPSSSLNYRDQNAKEGVNQCPPLTFLRKSSREATDALLVKGHHPVYTAKSFSSTVISFATTYCPVKAQSSRKRRRQNQR